MKAIKPLFILLLACCEFLVSFSQNNTVLSYFPQDAKIIIKISLSSLGQKMQWAEFAKTSMFNDIAKDLDEEGKSFLRNPGSTGIDLSQGIFVVMPVDKANQKAAPIFYGVVKDSSKFSAMMKKSTTEGQVVKIPNGKLIIDKKTAFAWNKEIFIITEDASNRAPAAPITESTSADDLEKMKQFTERCKAMLNKRKTPFHNERFNSVLKQQGDIYVWINNAEAQQQRKGKAPQVVAMFNNNLMRRSDYTVGVISFENGKIVMNMTQYLSASLDSLYKKYPPGNLNTDLVRRLPASHPIILFSFRFSPGMLNEMIVKGGGQKYIDSLSKKGIKMNELLSAIKGDVTAALIKVDDFDEADSVTRAMNGIQLLVAGTINNGAKFKELSNLVQASRNDSSKIQQGKKMRPVMLSQDSIFVVSLSQFAAQKYLATPTSNEEMERLIAPYERYPSAAIIDLKTIFALVMTGVSKNKSAEDGQQISEVLGMFDTLVSYGGSYASGALSSRSEITLRNKDQNSLKQFINLVELLKVIGSKKSSAFQRPR